MFSQDMQIHLLHSTITTVPFHLLPLSNSVRSLTWTTVWWWRMWWSLTGDWAALCVRPSTTALGQSLPSRWGRSPTWTCIGGLHPGIVYCVILLHQRGSDCYEENHLGDTLVTVIEYTVYRRVQWSILFIVYFHYVLHCFIWWVV